MRQLSLLSLLIWLCLLSSCATYPTQNLPALSAFYNGDFEKSALTLEKPSQEDTKDQLLYLLDRGMALQLSGRYKDSYKDFLKADKMSEVKDYTSLSTEAATLFTSDNIKQYKGEDFEKVLISAYLAIDYLLNGEFEDALVECRRVNEKLYKYKYEAKRDYEQNPFARYLSAVIWEASGKLEDAYIDYKETAKLAPEFPYLKYDLMRLSKQLSRPEDLKIWNKRYGDLEVPSRKEESKNGEVILIYQQGKSAVKQPNPASPRFPKFFPRYSQTQSARLEIAGAGSAQLSEKIYSVSDVAIKTLDDAYADLIAKRAVGIAAKAVVADQVRQKNELLGMLTWIGLNAIDQADIRHWSTLPESLQFIRMHIPPGAHKVKVLGLDSSGNPSGEQKEFDVIAVAGKKNFLTWRSLK